MISRPKSARISVSCAASVACSLTISSYFASVAVAASASSKRALYFVADDGEISPVRGRELLKDPSTDRSGRGGCGSVVGFGRLLDCGWVWWISGFSPSAGSDAGLGTGSPIVCVPCPMCLLDFWHNPICCR